MPGESIVAAGAHTGLHLLGVLSGQGSRERPAPMVCARAQGHLGLFSFSGLFRNKTLGSYRAFVTDHQRAVILRRDVRPVAVSPGEPELFAAALREHCRLAAARDRLAAG